MAQAAYQHVDFDELDQLLISCDTHIAGLRRAGQRRGLLGDRSVFVCTLLSAVVLPIILSIVLEMKPGRPGCTYWLTFGCLGLVQLSLGAFSMWGAREMGKLAQTVGRIEELCDLIKGIRQATRDLRSYADGMEGLLKAAVEQVHAIGSSLTMLRGILGTRHPAASAERITERLLNPMIQDRRDVLAFRDTSDLYNIAVYLWNEEAGHLDCFCRACDDRIDRQDRPWRPGNGHVGTCYARNRTLITPDSFDAAEFLSDDRDRDMRLYRSIAAFPIYGKDDDGIPSVEHSIGVLVMTSNIPHHFNEGYRIFGEAYAEMLALCLDHLGSTT
jgi:hypothetical protein